ncbi:MAG: diguanylate cyclase [Thermodesulfobacteriota bacterium]|nr:diguanylate cyclase [Thermodesulfobacteriota bacterium]
MTHKKILIVEDEWIIANDMKKTVEDMGYSVISVVMTGEEAIEKAEDEKPDLVLMDIVLKGKIDGIEAANEIHSRLNIPVLYLTAYTDEKILSRAKITEPYGYIVKPFQPRELYSNIHMALYKHQMEMKLREREEKYRSLVTNIPEVPWTRDDHGNIYFISQNVQKILGYTPEEVHGIGGDGWFESIHIEDMEKVRALYGELFEKRVPFDIEYRIKGKEDKWVWIHDRAIATYVKDGILFTDGIFSDISERKWSEQQIKQTSFTLEQTVEELKKANRTILEQQKSVIEEERLKVLLQMAGTAVYELDQPLADLLKTIESMKDFKDDPEKLSVHIANIEKAGKSIAHVTGKIQILPGQNAESHVAEPDFNHKEGRLQVLSIEDSELAFDIIEDFLTNQTNITVRQAKSLEEAWQEMTIRDYDLILLDHRLPDGNGLDFLKGLHKKRLTIPVVVLTGHGDEFIASQFIQSGAYEYLSKEKISEEALHTSIRNALYKSHLSKEITNFQEKLADMAKKDGLTGLHNRRYMNDIFKQEFSRARRYQTDLACMLIDLDFFKKVNDSLGHAFGDLVLKEFSRNLKNLTRDSDQCFRYGGEEFLVLLPNTDLQGAREVAEKVRTFFEHNTYDDGAHSRTVTISIGIASMIYHHPENPETLIGYADKALYRAKAEGRNCVRVYLQRPFDASQKARLQ